MKPATKKTIIIIVAVLIVALIVWLVFFRKQEWEKILEKLDIDETVKAEIRAEAKRLNADSATREQLKAEAEEYHLTYDKWLIMTAAMNLKYPVQQNYFGQIIINPKD